jgi:glycosyltransferase involved in cell wall biosynthesis
MKPLRICWFGIYDPKYPRNDILIKGLKENGVEIVECQADWKDKARYKTLIHKLKAVEGSCDFIYAAYPSNVPCIVAKIWTRKPVVMDALYSMYDAVVNDRQEVHPLHPRAIKLWLQDWIAALVADYIITDTEAHVTYWSRFPFVKASKMKTIYTGVQDHIFYPVETPHNQKFIVSFHGMYIPLQGIPKIVEAAHILQEEKDIHFRLIGGGHSYEEIGKQIKDLGLTNIEQLGKVSPEKVREYSNEADIMLGVFGDTEKTKRVVPNKVYEGMALRKPVITMDTLSVREIFGDGELVLISNTPKALAEAILRLKKDLALREKIARTGYERVITEFIPRALGAKLLQFLSTIT